MPAHGIDIVDRKELLSYKEMYRITRVLSELGVNKVRLTGGEPFVRKDFVSFLESLSFNDKLDEINITTNGALISNYIDKLEALNINAINLSIDSLHKEKFATITRRDVFENVFDTFEKLEKSNLKLKLNVVVQSGFNTDEIIDFVELSKDKDIAVRFIEEMPFNGKGQRDMEELWDFNKIINHIKNQYSTVESVVSKKSSTSKNYRIPSYKGTFGIIPAFTRTICNDCNRIRITATGMFKNCLFDGGVFNVRDFIRNGASDDELKELFIKTVHHKPENGFIAEANRGNDVSESMSTIGG
jgi:cyclic pyranopterin phosphate synthase